MGVALLMLLLGFAAPGVRADPPVVHLPVDPEAASAAALLAPFLQAQKATLIVLNQTRWTNAFLRQLDADIPRVVKLGPGCASAQGWCTNLRMASELSQQRYVRLAQLATTGRPDELVYIIKIYARFSKQVIRTILWTSVTSLRARDDVLRVVSHTKMWLGMSQLALALTAPDGSTVLYKLTCTSNDSCKHGAITVIEMDRWSAVEQRWSQRAAVFTEFCSWDWQMRGGGRALNVSLMTASGFSYKSSLMELAKSVQRSVGQGQQQRSRPVLNVTYQEENDIVSVMLGLRGCRQDALLTDMPVFAPTIAFDLMHVFDAEVTRVVVIVPAGLGPGVNVLAAVTVEFSAGLWCATGLAMLCTVVVFACARRQGVSGALLQALAPMVGQAPPPPTPPRPMLAAWLLVCVVLTAAYQGLLLGELSSAVPRRDLDSLRDLKNSGLTVHIQPFLSIRLSSILPLLPNARTNPYVGYSDIKSFIDTVASARNCALVAFLDRHVRTAMTPYMLTPKRLHYFPLGYSDRGIIAMAPRGSPLERPISRVLARSEAAGLRARWRSEEYERERQRHARRLVSLQGPRALSFWQLGPAFVVLSFGQAASVAVFVLEALWAWSPAWCPRYGPPVAS
ncbi:Ionotropic receptor 203 [Frankliniella occidentalis]|nr:Ionotropic receptor 203 [Frankliniella occidentalis]